MKLETSCREHQGNNHVRSNQSRLCVSAAEATVRGVEELGGKRLAGVLSSNSTQELHISIEGENTLGE